MSTHVKPDHWSDEHWQAWLDRERAQNAIRQFDNGAAEAQKERDEHRLSLIQDLQAQEAHLATYAHE